MASIVSRAYHKFVGGIDVNGNIIVAGTVDDRDIAADGAELDALQSTSHTWTASQIFDSGISFNSHIVVGSDLSKHIALFGTNYGLNITPGSMNVIANNVNTFSSTSTAVISKVNHDFDNGIDVTGNITASGTLAVTGATTLTGLLTANGGVDTTTIDASGAVDFDSTFNADGAATLGSTLGVTGATTLTGLLTANGGVDTTTIDASGAVDFDSTMNVDGAVTLGSTLGVTGATTLTGLLTANGGVGTTTLSTSGAATLGSTLDVTGATTVGGSLTVTGDLVVNGTTMTVNSTTISVDDKNIELGSVSSPSDVTADGGGITLKGSTDKTIIWIDSTDAWTLSEHLNIVSSKEYRIAGTSVLTSTTLGSGVTASSLTSVGTITSGTWSGSFGSVSGANLTNLTAGNLTGTIPSSVLGNSTIYVGTTSIALNRSSANQNLTGILSVALPGATSGTVTMTPAAVACTTSITIPATTGTLVTTGDTGTVTNTMLAGSIANAKLANSSVTINGVATSLGGSNTITANTPNNLVVKFDTGTTEGTDLYTFNGGSAKTVDIKAGTNVSLTKASGTITINSSVPGAGSTGWKYIDATIYYDGPGSSLPSWTQMGSYNMYAYAYTVNRRAYGYVHIPHEYKPSGEVRFAYHWTTSGTSTKLVKWRIIYTIAKGYNQSSNGDFFPETTITVEVAASGTAWRHMTSRYTTALPTTNLEPGSIILFRIARVGNSGGGENNDDVFLISVGINYQTDRNATLNEIPNFYA